MEDLDLHPRSPTTARPTGPAPDAQPDDVLRPPPRGRRVPPRPVVVEPARRRRPPPRRRVPGAPGQARRSRVETTRKAYREALAFAHAMAAAGGLDIARRAVVGGKLYPFMPLAHLREGMTRAGRRPRRRSRRGPCRRRRGRRLRRPGPRPRGRPRHTPTWPTACSSTTASTPSAAPTSATSSSSRTPSPTRRSCCSSRTTGRPRPSSTPPTPSSPTTSAASPRSCGPTRARATRSSATTPTTRSTRPSGSPARSPACTTGDRRSIGAGTGRRGSVWGDIAVFYRTNAQSRVLEEQLMRADIPYKVVGGTRFYDRREIKDAIAYLRAVVNPADEVSIKRVLNEPKRGVGDTSDRQARRLGHRPRPAVPRRPAPGRRGRRRAARPPRASRRSSACSTTSSDLAGGQPGPAAAAAARAVGLPRRARGRAHDRGRGPAREPGRAGGGGQRGRDRRRVPRADQPGGRHRRPRRRRHLGRAHDAALGQGPRVPGRVPHRPRGRRLPPPALPHRARPARGGAAPRLRGHHPGPAAALPHPRVEPHAVRRHAVQPAQPVPRRDPRRTWSATSRGTAGPAAAAAAYGGGGGGRRRSGGPAAGATGRCASPPARSASSTGPWSPASRLAVGAERPRPQDRRRRAPQRVRRGRDPRHERQRRQDRGARAVPRTWARSACSCRGRRSTSCDDGEATFGHRRFSVPSAAPVRFTDDCVSWNGRHPRR